MTTFFASDHHFGHVNIIEYCARPFDDVDHMNWSLVARWNAVVAPEDEVWHLGDLCLGRLEESLRFIRLLNGRITLVPGNHDRCRDKPTSEDRYLDAGIETITRGPLEVEDFLLDHFPFADTDPTDRRYEDERPKDEGQWLIHGHVHEKWRQRGRMVNVGVDVWNGAPVPLEALRALRDAGERDLPALPWR